MKFKSLLTLAIMIGSMLILLTSCSRPEKANTPESVANNYLEALKNGETKVANLISKILSHPKVLRWKIFEQKPIRSSKGSWMEFRTHYSEYLELEKELRSEEAKRDFTGKEATLSQIRSSMEKIRLNNPELYEIRDSGLLGFFIGDRKFSTISGSYEVQVAEFHFNGILQVSNNDPVEDVFNLKVARMKIDDDYDSGWKAFDIRDSQGKTYTVPSPTIPLPQQPE